MHKLPLLAKGHFGMKKLQSTGKTILDKTSLPVKNWNLEKSKTSVPYVSLSSRHWFADKLISILGANVLTY